MKRNSRKKFRWRAWLLASALCAVTVRQPLAADENTLAAGMREAAVRQGTYQISSFEDLKELSGAVSLCDGAFEADVQLMCDVYAAGTFFPIGDALHRFEGTFDGGGYAIDGLRIGGSGEFQGLFGYVGNSGVVKNVTVRNAHVSGMHYTGGIAAYSSGTIENCRIERSNIIGRSALEYGTATGGIAALSCGRIAQCTVLDSRVIGWRNVGGIAGSQHAQEMSLCISSGKVISFHEGYSQAGGIAGSVQTDAQMKGCISLCSVYSRGQWTGGIAGSFQSGKMLGCMAIGEVEGSSAGGVVGYAAPRSQMIRCVYIGDLPAGIGQGKQKSGVQVLRGDKQRLERSRMWLSVLPEQAGFMQEQAG